MTDSGRGWGKITTTSNLPGSVPGGAGAWMFNQP